MSDDQILALLSERCEAYAGAIGRLEATIERLDELLKRESITAAERAAAIAQIEQRRAEIRDLFPDRAQ